MPHLQKPLYFVSFQMSTNTSEVVGVTEPDSACGEALEGSGSKPEETAGTLEKDNIECSAAADGSGDVSKSSPCNESPEGSVELPVESQPSDLPAIESKTIQQSASLDEGNCQTTTDSDEHVETRPLQDNDQRVVSESSGNKDQSSVQMSDNLECIEPESSTAKPSSVCSDKDLETKCNVSSDLDCSKRERLSSDEPESSTTNSIAAEKTLKVQSNPFPSAAEKGTGDDGVSSSDRDLVDCGGHDSLKTSCVSTDVPTAPDSSVLSDDSPMEVDNPTQICPVDTTESSDNPLDTAVEKNAESSDHLPEQVSQSHSPEMSSVSANNCNTITSDSQNIPTEKVEEPCDKVSDNVVTDSNITTGQGHSSQEASVSQSDSHRKKSEEEMEVSDSQVSQSASVERPLELTSSTTPSEPMYDTVVTGTNDFKSQPKSTIQNSDTINDMNHADTTGIGDNSVGQSGQSDSTQFGICSEALASGSLVTQSESSDPFLGARDAVLAASSSEQSMDINSSTKEKCEPVTADFQEPLDPVTSDSHEPLDPVTSDSHEPLNPVTSDSQETLDPVISASRDGELAAETVTSNTPVVKEDLGTVDSNMRTTEKESSTSDESVHSNTLVDKEQTGPISACEPSQPQRVFESTAPSEQSETINSNKDIGHTCSPSPEVIEKEVTTLVTSNTADTIDQSKSNVEAANEDPETVTSKETLSSQSEQINSDVAKEETECESTVENKDSKSESLLSDKEEIVKESENKETNILPEGADSNMKDIEDTSDGVAPDTDKKTNSEKIDSATSNTETIEKCTFAKDQEVCDKRKGSKPDSLISLDDNSLNMSINSAVESESTKESSEIVAPESTILSNQCDNNNQTESSSSSESIEKVVIDKNIDESSSSSLRKLESDLSSKSDEQNVNSSSMEIDPPNSEISITKELKDQQAKSSLKSDASVSDMEIPDSDVEMTEIVWQTRKRKLDGKRSYNPDVDLNESSDSNTFSIPTFLSSSKALDKQEPATPSSDIFNPDTPEWVEPATPQSEETSMDTPGPFTPGSAIAAPDTPISEIQYIDTPGPFTPISEISNDASNQAPLSTPTPAKRACADNASRDTVYEEYEQ